MARALSIPRGLRETFELHASGERRADVLEARMRAHVEKVATSIDYVTVADAETLEPASPGSLVSDRALLAVALRIGTTRLIDNLEFSLAA